MGTGLVSGLLGAGTKIVNSKTSLWCQPARGTDPDILDFEKVSEVGCLHTRIKTAKRGRCSSPRMSAFLTTDYIETSVFWRLTLKARVLYADVRGSR